MPLVAPATAASTRNSRVSTIVQSMISDIDSRIAGKTPSVAKPMFVGYNINTRVIERNPDCWANDIAGIAGFSNWNTHGGHLYGAFLLAPDIVASAYHIGPYPAITTFDWVTMDGELVSRTTSAITRIGSTDLMLSKLTSPAPSTIPIVKVLPDEYFQELVSLINGGTRIPVLAFDQEAKVLVSDTLTENATSSSQVPSDATRLSFCETLIEGDSSHGRFLVLGQELIALSTIYNGGSGNGPSIHYNRAAINAAMTSLGSTYQLTEISI